MFDGHPATLLSPPAGRQESPNPNIQIIAKESITNVLNRKHVNIVAFEILFIGFRRI
jgi:hypothetical protein